MPKSSRRAQGGKKIHKQILRDERKGAKKVARAEVAKARRVVRRKGQWTVAAGAMGYHAGYDSKEGFFARRGNLYGRGGVATQPVGTYQIPASSSYVFRPFYTTKPGPRGGLIVCGTQNIGTIQSSAAATAGAFTIGGSRTTNFFLSPDDIGGPMALDARKYNFYRFKKVKLIIPMNASSTDTYNMAIAYLPDPASSTFATIDYNTMQQATDLFVGGRKQLYGPIVIDVTMLNKAQFKKYNTEIDTTDSMSIRACRQGVFFGIFDAVDSANLKYGDIVMEYELELYDRCPDYGFTLQVSDLPLIAKIQKDMVRIVEEHKSRGDSDESIEKRLPRWKSQLRQIDRYVRSHLPSADDSRLGTVTCLSGPNGANSAMVIAGGFERGGSAGGYSIGSLGAMQFAQGAGDVATGTGHPVVGVHTVIGSSVGIVPASTSVGTTAGMSDLTSNINVTNLAGQAVKAGTSGVQAAATFTVVPADTKSVNATGFETKDAPVSGALPIPEFDEKRLSANALKQLPLLRSLANMPSDKRRTAMKDIVTYGYDTLRKQWPPIVSEFPGALRMIAQHLVDMSGAEARRQDDSDSSDEDVDEKDFVIIPSDKGTPNKLISYGEFRLKVGDTEYSEYQKLRANARVAQRSYSIDPTDPERRTAMAKCQSAIVQYLKGLYGCSAEQAFMTAIKMTKS